MSSDPYAPYAKSLPIADLVQPLVQRRLRRDIADILRTARVRTFLDVGGGTGTLAAMLARRGIETTVLDSSPTMLARARKKASKLAGLHAIAGDAAALPFGPDFDAAYTGLMLHEMNEADRIKVWNEMNRVVGPGGLLMIFDFISHREHGLLAKFGERLIRNAERKIGKTHPPHYENYKIFMAGGGLSGFLERRDAAAVERRQYLFGNIGLAVVEKNR